MVQGSLSNARGHLPGSQSPDLFALLIRECQKREAIPVALTTALFRCFVTAITRQRKLAKGYEPEPIKVSIAKLQKIATQANE